MDCDEENMMERGTLNILIAAGGTGGHVYPGVAIAESIVSREPRCNVTFVGTSNGPEAKLVPDAGWPIRYIGPSSIHSGGVWNRLRTYLMVPGALIRSFKVIREEHPNAVIGTGGFATGPLVMGAALKRIPTAIVEPNAIAGRSNRLLSHVVKKVFVAFDSAAPSFPPRKVLVTGNPVRRAIVEVSRSAYDATRPLTVFCYGGSQGARPLNEAMIEAVAHLSDYRDRIRIIHQVGSIDAVEQAVDVYKRAELEAEVFAFTECIAGVYAEADVALARAGGGTIAELAATTLPAILVPLPHAVDDHQRANADELVRVGGAVLMRQSQLSGKSVASALIDFVHHPEKLKAMREALENVARCDAADVVARECLNMMRANEGEDV